MIKKSLLYTVILALTSPVSSLALAAPFTLKATEQNTIELKNAPQNIAVYDLTILDTLNALGIDAKIVPETSFNGDLAKYQNNQFIKAGSLFEPDLEKLKAAKPDLIFVGGRSAKAQSQLQQLAPTVSLSAQTEHYVADLEQRTQLLAKAFKREKIANEKLAEVKKLQAELKSLTQNKSALMLFVNKDNYMLHAANDRFGFVYDLTGFKSVLPLSEKSDAPRPEAGSATALALAEKNAQLLKKAVEAQPDYIILLDRGAVNTQQYTAKDSIKTHPVLSQSDAVKNNQVINVNADSWYLTGAGLDNTIAMLKELKRAIQP
ncbi:ABC transporter substrate-binding protein [Acinetobacter cumulans]|uniref:ABC transporter substrate-binding protein n=1 Tax=Acinetobacter cumulans TaxID=2136182 RepID=UPI000D12ADC6|nr:ABC transporter substrate-binding protein [Acinetobacter cumulans]QCO21469.1 ABC transporter substrate-binding protein [Acinetobacter cumulans]